MANTYNPEMYLFRPDGTYLKFDPATNQMVPGKMVTVPDPTGELNALNGLGGQGFADVPEDWAQEQGLTITGARGQDPIYDANSRILEKAIPGIIAAVAAPQMLGQFMGAGAAGVPEAASLTQSAVSPVASQAMTVGTGLGVVGGEADILGSLAATGGGALPGGATAFGIPAGLGALGAASGAAGAGTVGGEADILGSLAATGGGAVAGGATGLGVAEGAAAGTLGGAAGSALSRIISGSGTAADWASIAAGAAPGLLGAYGASQQAGALTDLSRAQQEAEQARYTDIVSRDEARYKTAQDQLASETAKRDAALAEYKGFGAPYRSRLSDLYADPASYLSSPDVQAPVQQGTDAMARSLSAKVGNPIGNPGALQQIQDYTSNTLYGKLGQEKDRLAGFGGLTSYNQSGAGVPGVSVSLPTGASAGSGVGTGAGANTAVGALGADNSMWANLGGAVSDVVNPKQLSLADIYKKMYPQYSSFLA